MNERPVILRCCERSANAVFRHPESSQRRLTTMKRVAASLFVLFLAVSAFAHAGHHHVFGTVKQLKGDALLVHTREGTDATISLTKATVYKRGDADATRADLVPGVRVVIDMTTDGKSAESVKIGVAK